MAEEDKAAAAPAAKPGIVYFAKIPPYVTPQQMRALLGRYGAVGRVYLTPESEDVRRARRKRGGSARRNFTDGWVEFDDRRVARVSPFRLCVPWARRGADRPTQRVARTLHNTAVGPALPKRALFGFSRGRRYSV